MGKYETRIIFSDGSQFTAGEVAFGKEQSYLARNKMIKNVSVLSSVYFKRVDDN